MKPRLLIIVGALMLGVVLAAVWFLNTPPALPPVEAMTPVSVSTPRPMATPAPAQPAPKLIVKREPGGGMKPRPEPTPEVPLADWEIKISQILESKANETETAQMLINLLPTLPAEGQAEAAQHVANLITDPDYGRVLPLLRNAALPEEVHSVLVTDLMNREDTVKLPALLDIARNANHPFHDEAVSDLQIFLDQDNGTNWAKWDTAVKDYLKKQAQDQAGLEPDAATAPAIK